MLSPPSRDHRNRNTRIHPTTSNRILRSLLSNSSSSHTAATIWRISSNPTNSNHTHSSNKDLVLKATRNIRAIPTSSTRSRNRKHKRPVAKVEGFWGS
jgi:hypothetical protein